MFRRNALSLLHWVTNAFAYPKGSPESLICDMEEENYGSGIPVTGELFVSMRYEMRFSKFELHVHSANNLASADSKKGSSDP